MYQIILQHKNALKCQIRFRLKIKNKLHLCSVGFLSLLDFSRIIQSVSALTSSAVSTLSLKAFIACSTELERWRWYWRQCWINSKQKLHPSAELAVMLLLDFVPCQQDETLPTAHTQPHTHTPAANLHPLTSVEFYALSFLWKGWKNFDLRYFTKDERGFLDKRVFFRERNITLVWFSEDHNWGHGGVTWNSLRADFHNLILLKISLETDSAKVCTGQMVLMEHQKSKVRMPCFLQSEAVLVHEKWDFVKFSKTLHH